MERAPFDIEGGHLRVTYLGPLRIGPCVEFAAHSQSGCRCGGTDDGATLMFRGGVMAALKCHP